MRLLPLLLLLLLAAALPAAAEEGEPADLAGRMRRQDALVEGGRAGEALAEARARVQREPRSPEALYLLGRLLGNTGKLEEARARFEGALELDINYAPAWRGMALVHLRKKEYETASREARRAFDIAPDAESRVLLVQCLLEKGDRAGAHRLLQEELAARPGDNDLRSFYATVLFNERLYQSAEKELRQVLAAAPDHLPARQTLVFLLLNTGRPDEATAECREAVRRTPGDPQFRLLLRDLLVEREAYAEAAGVMEEVLRLELSAADRAKAEADLKALRSAAAAPSPGKAPTPEEVLQRLQSPDVLRRREAARLLWEADLSFLPDEVVRRITDPDETVRIFVVRLLGRHGSASAAGLLEVLLFHPRDRDASVRVRAHAAEALGAIGGPAALPVLLRAVEEPEPDVLRGALLGIRSVTGKSLVEDPYAPVPEAERPAVRERYRRWWMEDPTGRHWRRKAALAAGASNMRSLAQYVIPWLEEEDASIRGAVLEAVATLTKDPSWRSVPTGTAEERRAAREKAAAAVMERR